jgi:hypothetical protein
MKMIVRRLGQRRRSGFSTKRPKKDCEPRYEAVLLGQW